MPSMFESNQLKIQVLRSETKYPHSNWNKLISDLFKHCNKSFPTIFLFSKKNLSILLLLYITDVAFLCILFARCMFYQFILICGVCRIIHNIHKVKNIVFTKTDEPNWAKSYVCTPLSLNSFIHWRSDRLFLFFIIIWRHAK